MSAKTDLILPAGSAIAEVPHQANTFTPDIRVFQREGDDWRLLGPGAYEAAATSASSVRLRFPFVLPADTYRAVIADEAAAYEVEPFTPGAGYGARLKAFRLRGHRERTALFPATIRLGTTAADPEGDAAELAASTGGLVRKESALQSGGYNDGDDIIFRVAKDVLEDLPEVGTRLVWVERSLVFVISSTRDGGDNDPRWKLGCRQKLS